MMVFLFDYLQADDKTRAAMFKLRQTWNVLFNLRTLYQIDVKCHSKDNKWPIVQLPPNTSSSIHVNPKFLNTSKVSRLRESR